MNSSLLRLGTTFDMSSHILQNHNSIYDLFKGGAIPGVTVNGDKITIRGGSSFNLDNEPLFVVDGTLYESSSEVDGVVSINDIDKVEIQKDGASYGMKGAQGVLVTSVLVVDGAPVNTSVAFVPGELAIKSN